MASTFAAPALKRVHAGTAMGREDSAAAKAAAAQVLADDNLTLIVAAVRDGLR